MAVQISPALQVVSQGLPREGASVAAPAAT
jgi:hypothetical protein